MIEKRKFQIGDIVDIEVEQIAWGMSPIKIYNKEIIGIGISSNGLFYTVEVKDKVCKMERESHCKFSVK